MGPSETLMDPAVTSNVNQERVDKSCIWMFMNLRRGMNKQLRHWTESGQCLAGLAAVTKDRRIPYGYAPISGPCSFHVGREEAPDRPTKWRLSRKASSLERAPVKCRCPPLLQWKCADDLVYSD